MKLVAETTTLITKRERYDWLTDQLLTWVREVPLESDAVDNIPRILKAYEKRKPFKQKLRQLFNV